MSALRAVPDPAEAPVDDAELEATADAMEAAGYTGMTPPTDDERPDLARDAVRWRRGRDRSARAAGFDDAEDLERYLASPRGQAYLDASREAADQAMAPDPTVAPTFVSAADVERPADVDDYDVARLVRRRGLVVLAGTEGSGKTQLTVELAIRLATGTGALAGHFEIPQPLTVAYVDEENGATEMYRREESVLAALRLERAALKRLHRMSFAGVHLGRPKSQAWLLEQLQSIRPGVVILDTAGVMVDDEWGAPLKDAVRYLRTLTAELDCSIVLLVHLVKAPREGKSSRAAHGTSLGDVMGQWGRHADVVALLADLGAGRVRLTVRKRVPPASLVLVQQDGITSVVAVTAGDETPASLDDRILRAIDAGATAADEIMTALGTPEKPLARRTFYDALGRLRRDGFVADGTPLRLTDAGDEAVA